MSALTKAQADIAYYVDELLQLVDDVRDLGFEPASEGDQAGVRTSDQSDPVSRIVCNERAGRQRDASKDANRRLALCVDLLRTSVYELRGSIAERRSTLVADISDEKAPVEYGARISEAELAEARAAQERRRARGEGHGKGWRDFPNKAEGAA